MLTRVWLPNADHCQKAACTKKYREREVFYILCPASSLMDVQHSALYSSTVKADMVRDSCIHDNNALRAA